MTSHATWDFLHDGEITRLDGVVPGDVRLFVEIPYLRKAFREQGTAFVLTLFDCTSLRLETNDGRAVHSFAEISSRRPILLTTTSEVPLSIYTTEGTLNLEYARLSVSLESGTRVELAELERASESYWTAWSKVHGTDT